MKRVVNQKTGFSAWADLFGIADPFPGLFERFSSRSYPVFASSFESCSRSFSLCSALTYDVVVSPSFGAMRLNLKRGIDSIGWLSLFSPDNRPSRPESSRFPTWN
jgi:hypothetical protein